MQESGRTKAMLCELIIVTLFLALSSVTLLRLFAASNAVSVESERLACATVLAQDALESLAAGQEVPGVQEKVLGEQTYTVAAETRRETSVGGTLYTYAVTVSQGDETLTAMETSAYRPERSAP